MTLRAILTLSATFAVSAALLPYTATAQDSETVSNTVNVQNASFQPISDASIEAAIEISVMSGEHDAALNQKYGEGVAQAFRGAYAINVMNPLWTETSAKELIKAVSIMEEAGSVDQSLKQQAEQALNNRFEGTTAKQRAEGDMALSMTYIHLEDLHNAPDAQASEMAPPRLAGLDSHLISAAQSGKASYEDYKQNFSSF